MDSERVVEKPKIDVRNPRVLRRNVTALMIDSGGFGMAMGFIGYSTVLPALALALTHSEPLVGLVSTVWTGIWLLPQLFAGRWMAGRPRKFNGSTLLITSNQATAAIASAPRKIAMAIRKPAKSQP